MNLEDKVAELEEAVADLEAIQDINDQLQEDSRELEMQLREELDIVNANMREVRIKEKLIHFVVKPVTRLGLDPPKIFLKVESNVFKFANQKIHLYFNPPLYSILKKISYCL